MRSALSRGQPDSGGGAAREAVAYGADETDAEAGRQEAAARRAAAAGSGRREEQPAPAEEARRQADEERRRLEALAAAEAEAERQRKLDALTAANEAERRAAEDRRAALAERERREAAQRALVESERREVARKAEEEQLRREADAAAEAERRAAAEHRAAQAARQLQEAARRVLEKNARSEATETQRRPEASAPPPASGGPVALHTECAAVTTEAKREPRPILFVISWFFGWPIMAQVLHAPARSFDGLIAAGIGAALVVLGLLSLGRFAARFDVPFWRILYLPPPQDELDDLRTWWLWLLPVMWPILLLFLFFFLLPFFVLLLHPGLLFFLRWIATTHGSRSSRLSANCRFLLYG